MARGCDAMADKEDHENGECEIPMIQIDSKAIEVANESLLVEDDDDAAVFLQELGINFGITARSKGRASVFQSVEVSREGSAVSSGMSSVISRQKSSRTLVDVVSRVTQGGEGQLYRLLSAKRNHVQQLNSDIIFLQRRIKELEEQNRLLVRVGKRQEAALRRYQDMKSELPHIIEAHKIEIHVLQEKLRRATETNRRSNEKLKDTDGRILKLTEELSRLRNLSKKRHLPERDQLNRKLSATVLSLDEKGKEAEELKRRLAIVEKSLKQQVQAEVARHRATAKKLYGLQCEHHKLEDTLQERDRELAALQQYSRRAGRNLASSNSTTATSSRSASISSRRKSGGRNRGSGSSTTTTSGIVSSIETISTACESRASVSLDAGRLPPISADLRKRSSESQMISSTLTVSPEPTEVPTRRSRHRSKLNKENTEDRRVGRLRRGRQSPHHSTDDDYLASPRCTPTTSPTTTPEPQMQQQSESNEEEATDGCRTLPGHSDQRKRQSLAASLQEARQKDMQEGSNKEESPETCKTIQPTVTREYSLIENYPPRERGVLTGGSSGGSDSGSGVSPPPIKPVAFVTEGRVQSRLSRLESPMPSRGVHRRRTTGTAAAAEVRSVSSLSKLDANTPAKPSRSAITP
ncbi:lebercilin-like protein isoform X2 [Macrobrachium nipponense]|uniref:lebercilin-like protein isoform X2 n=1 Tax=Macrobrachium nipponense TaxID=159736 RepID=UPI0030C80046